jgi:choice-of-anchor A domain-containing protein
LQPIKFGMRVARMREPDTGLQHHCNTQPPERPIIMRIKLITLTALAGGAWCAGTSGAHAQVTTLQGLLDAGYNTYVSGDIGSASSAYVSDSQGAIAAGGNVYLSNFGASTNETASGVGVAVGGNLTMTNGSINGTADVGGNLSATSTALSNVNVGGSMSYLYGQVNGSVNVDGSANFTGAGVNGTVAVGGAASFVNSAQPTVTAATAYAAPINYSAVTANATAVSAALSGTASTAGDTFTKNAQGQYVFTSTVAGDNIFNVTAAQIAAMSGSQVLFNSTVAGATDIINVVGSGTEALPGNLSFGYTGGMTDSNVLLNMGTAATTVQLSSNVRYDLSILAPDATVVTSGGNVTGSLIAANLTGNAQLDLSNSGGVTFSGALPAVAQASSLAASVGTASPAPLPLPGSSPLGLIVLAWFGRGRLRRAAAVVRSRIMTRR